MAYSLNMLLFCGLLIHRYNLIHKLSVRQDEYHIYNYICNYLKFVF